MRGLSGARSRVARRSLPALGPAASLWVLATAFVALLSARNAPLVSAASSSSVNAVPFIAPQHFVNTNVVRVVDLQNPAIVREVATVTAKNTASGPEDAYYVTIDSALADLHLASLEVIVKGEKTKLVVQKGQYDATIGKQFYKVILPAPLPAGDSVQLVVGTSYVHLTENLPKKISQSDRTSRVYEGNQYFDSPYTTEKSKTTVKTPPGKVHSHSPAASSVSGNQYSFTFKGELAPHKREPVRFHFEVPYPVLVLESVTRKIQVSHWQSKVEFSEDSVLVHDGPRLREPFSRIDFARSQNYGGADGTMVASGFKLFWPAGARDPWYRDVDGNVSTSHFRNEASHSVFEMRPRYPIYGGWKFSWSHGYEVPMSSGREPLVKYDSSQGRYVLKARVYEGLKNVPADKLTLEVILPEGASDIKVFLPFEADSENDKTTYSYFDSIGRPTRVFVKKRFVDEMWSEFIVTYRFPVTAYLRKPLVIATGIFVFLASVVFIGRIDTSITKDPSGATQSVSKALDRAHRKLEDAYEDYNGRHRDAALLLRARADAVRSMEYAEAELRRSGSSMADLWARRRRKLLEHQDEVLNLHQLGSQPEAEKKRQEVGKKLEAIKAEIAAVDKELGRK
ncbi:Ribophorin I-domain-containing protein [Hyaloraphidium curvatum]|nr:Ribophorin I-domain-containing protein [Hyaloraphidium curvatum]